MNRPARTIALDAAPAPAVHFDELLSPHVIRKLAWRKGFTVEQVTKGKSGRRFVTLADPRGATVDNPGKFRGFTLLEAKVYLSELPDRT
jgi:hypothetical protein